jgi:adenine/guanine phosphoribosyltransferase-like PRPP-binding protein
MIQQSSQELIAQYGNDPTELLKACGGYYECIKDETGVRLTPLVGYAGKYPTSDKKELQYVGEVYANFSKAEENPAIMFHLTQMLKGKIKHNATVFVGPQMGGIAVGQFLAYHCGVRFACAEKEITQLKTDELREQSRLVFKRHEIKEGDMVIIAEDVLNNFSTTKELINLVEEKGATVCAIVALLNRSLHVDVCYTYNKKNFPVIALVRKPYAEYEQHDEEVADDIAKGNVVLKPKDEWSKLMHETEQALRVEDMHKNA